jgi:hypothetical protein
VAPTGDHAFALAGPGRLGSPSSLLHLDLRTGTSHLLATVPGSGAGGLALVAGRLFVPDPEGGTIAVVDPRSGAMTRSIRVGGTPAAVAGSCAPDPGCG